MKLERKNGNSSFQAIKILHHEPQALGCCVHSFMNLHFFVLKIDKYSLKSNGQQRLETKKKEKKRNQI